MMRVDLECRNCGLRFEVVVDSGIGDTNESVVALMERDGDDVCVECDADEARYNYTEPREG